MPRPRSQQVSLEATPYYHCISRCVRRAFLCGDDRFSGQSYEHRRGWIVQRMAELAEVFAIDVCAYAVMSNHYHAVLRIDAERAALWPANEVAERWMRLFQGNLLVRRWLTGALQDDEAAETRALEIIETWRDKLRDLSWFMRCLNEHVARRANLEDSCTGRFWEGRFKSQALLDEPAVLACMAYVDLNPIRAGMAELPENSDHTSIQQRIAECKDTAASINQGTEAADNAVIKPCLLPFLEANNTDNPDSDTVCNYRLMDYLELVDWTGRALRQNKRGAIPETAPDIFNRLAIDPATWLKHMRPRQSRMLVAIGAMDRLKQYIKVTGRKWLMHQQEAAALSPT